MKSVRSELLKWVLGALCLGSVVLVLVAYVFSLGEMNEVLDNNLHDVANALGEYHGSRSGTRRPMDDRNDYGDLITQITRANGTTVFSSNPQVVLPPGQVAGDRVEIVDGTEWRVYTRLGDGATVQVAQRTKARKQMAGEAASRLVLPLVLLTLLIGALIVFGLRRGLRSLDDTAAQMSARTAASLAPLSDAEVPREMRPLVVAFNDLMHRLDSAFSMQRRFVADAAHELRTPVAALRLQMQLLERARDDDSRTAAIHELRGGMDRTARLVEQLLQLSRAQPDVDTFNPVPISLDDLVRSVVSDFNGLAVRARVDLGMCAHGRVIATADPDQIRVLLNNLVRNALHFAPTGSRIDVSATLEGGRPKLAVCDCGPGIPEQERARVLDRFYRGHSAGLTGDPAGSGLGLAIVKAIADRHGAELGLSSRPDGPGLEVSLLFSA